MRMLGEVCVLGLGRRQAESLVGDLSSGSRQANSLVRVGICWGDSRHKSNSPLHAILNSSWVVHVVPVIIVDVHKSINNHQNNGPMLEVWFHSKFGASRRSKRQILLLSDKSYVVAGRICIVL